MEGNGHRDPAGRGAEALNYIGTKKDSKGKGGADILGGRPLFKTNPTEINNLVQGIVALRGKLLRGNAFLGSEGRKRSAKLGMEEVRESAEIARPETKGKTA